MPFFHYNIGISLISYCLILFTLQFRTVLSNFVLQLFLQPHCALSQRANGPQAESLWPKRTGYVDKKASEDWWWFPQNTDVETKTFRAVWYSESSLPKVLQSLIRKPTGFGIGCVISRNACHNMQKLWVDLSSGLKGFSWETNRGINVQDDSTCLFLDMNTKAFENDGNIWEYNVYAYKHMQTAFTNGTVIQWAFCAVRTANDLGLLCEGKRLWEGTLGG